MRTGSNIRKRADGRFEARYIKARDIRGGIIYGYCYGKTYQEAEQKRDEAVALLHTAREMNLLILGAGSHGKTVRELAEALGVFRKIAFLDDDPDKRGVIGPCKKMKRYLREFPIAIPAVGDRDLRMRWLSELGAAGFVLPVLIHPTAVVSSTAEIGCGTVIEARATIGAGAKIGRGCIVCSGATIDRDVSLEDGSLVMCGQIVSPANRGTPAIHD